jgi:hypothetical protein
MSHTTTLEPIPSSRGETFAPIHRRLDRLLLAGLFALVVWETAALLLQHLRAPQERHFQSAAEKLRQARRPDEPLLFAPLWMDPLGRQRLGDGLDLELLLLSDVDRFPRVWQASLRGAHHPWLEGLAPSESWSFGPLTLALFQKPAQEVLFDFTRQIRRARVDRVGDHPARCTWRDERFSCDPRQAWNWVGRNLAEVDHRPYRCIYAHPVDGHRMRIAFEDVPLGKDLVGYTGIDDFENRKKSKQAVLLDISVGDRRLGTIRHQNHWPWQRFTLDTGNYAGQIRSVRFEVSPAESAFARTFCFHAEARR